MSEIIKAYKGFNKDMTCRGKQYEEGRDYEEAQASACNYGMHACEYPLDCFRFYEPGKSVYHVVEQSGDISKDSDDTKIASTKMHIGARLDIAGMVKAAVEFTMSKVKNSGKNHNTGNCGASSNTGNCGASSNTGNYGASSNTGNYGASSNTGDYGASSNTGYRGASSNTGDYGASSNTGNYGASSNTGDYGASSNTGNCGASSNTGYRGSSEAGHENSVAVSWGPEAKAKGVKGAFLVLAEWQNNGGNHWEEDAWTFVGAAMVRVDGDVIKEDTFYELKDGKVVEWTDDDE